MDLNLNSIATIILPILLLAFCCSPGSSQTAPPEPLFQVTLSAGNFTPPPFFPVSPTSTSKTTSTSTNVNSVSVSPSSSSPSTIASTSGDLSTSSTTTRTTTPSISNNNTSVEKITLRLGFLMANDSVDMRFYYGFGQSAPAAQLAIKNAREAGLIPGIEFEYVWYICDCDHTEAVGGAVQLILYNHSDVIFGPPCNIAALSSADVSTYYNVPQMVWGAASSPKLANMNTYPTVPVIAPNTYQSALSVVAMLIQYRWSEVALIYSADLAQAMCAPTAFPTDFQNAIGAVTSINITITYTKLMNETEESVKEALRALQSYARIVIACIDSDVDQRNFLIWANQLGMSSVEWVYIMPQISGAGMQSKSELNNNAAISMWENPSDPNDTGNNAAALATCQRTFVIDIQEQNQTRIQDFNKNLLALQGSYPFNCSGPCLGPNASDKSAATYAYTLYNAVYAYLCSVNVTREQGGTLEDIRNGTLISAVNLRGTWPGVQGPIVVSDDGTVEPTFSVWALDTTETPTVFLTVQIVDMFINQYTVYLNYSDAASTIWATRNGVAPLYKPLCGYQGTQCPQSMLLWFLVGGGALLFVTLLAAFAIGYAIYSKNKQLERMNEEVLVPWIELTKLEPNRKDDPTNKSYYSVGSSQTGSSSLSDGIHSRLAGANIRLESDHHCFFIRQKEIQTNFVQSNGEMLGAERQTYFAHKYPTRVRLFQEDLKRLRMVRQLDHDNLNKFIGVCVDGPICAFALWKVCQRGAIWNAIESGNKYIQDPYIMNTLIKDLANGLLALHQSFLRVHGWLTSESCLISDRWELKITDYGTDILRVAQIPEKKMLLWTAPEHLRSGDLAGTREGDVYSFALICSELVNNETVWGGISDEKDIEETLRSIQNSSRTLPYRPRLESREELNPLLYQMIRDCWVERPEDRPNIEQIRSTLKTMLKNSEQNLIDYVMGMMEQYATSLEKEVDERTRELVEEKKKSDILLYRMLPPQVVDKLKAGETVEPEHFPLATVFFSDIVRFTVLASKCTPFQVVNILNSLYTGLDNIIEAHDVYKVETIGDGYLVVSGVPRRNGDRHVAEIARLSFGFMHYIGQFRIDHLAGERIQLRIGFHTGPVVAGVVGLAMPRYCLFGDTVNTASRMESNGKPGHIQITASSNHFLTNVIGGFRTESRGEVIIKGKGVMETFWLLGRVGEPPENPNVIATVGSPTLTHVHDPLNGVITAVESPPPAPAFFH